MYTVSVHAQDCFTWNNNAKQNNTNSETLEAIEEVKKAQDLITRIIAGNIHFPVPCPAENTDNTPPLPFLCPASREPWFLPN